MDAAGIDPAGYTRGRTDLAEALPWDPIDVGVSKAFLQQEWRRAEAALTTPDCRTQGCQDCGVCDFAVIAPRLADGAAVVTTASPPGPQNPLTLDLFFEKIGRAAFLSHLETIKVFERALRRADVPLDFSKGFHPKPHLVFDDALPVGMQSRREKLSIRVTTPMAPEAVQRRLNQALPEGLSVVQCRVADNKKNLKTIVYYTVDAGGGVFAQTAINSFWQSQTCPLEKGRGRIVDLKAAVTEMALIGPGTLRLGLQPVHGVLLRPAEVLRSVFQWDDERLRLASVIKEG
jgi:radical SAM-linked protein